MGRPDKLTPQVQATVCALLRKGLSKKRAAFGSGIDEKTFYNWINRGRKANRGKYRDFYLATEAAIADYQRMLLTVVLKGSVELNQPRLALQLLERRFPQEFSPNRTVTLQGGDSPVRSEVTVAEDHLAQRPGENRSEWLARLAARRAELEAMDLDQKAAVVEDDDEDNPNFDDC